MYTYVHVNDSTTGLLTAICRFISIRFLAHSNCLVPPIGWGVQSQFEKRWQSQGLYSFMFLGSSLVVCPYSLHSIFHFCVHHLLMELFIHFLLQPWIHSSCHIMSCHIISNHVKSYQIISYSISYHVRSYHISCNFISCLLLHSFLFHANMIPWEHLNWLPRSQESNPFTASHCHYAF